MSTAGTTKGMRYSGQSAPWPGLTPSRISWMAARSLGRWRHSIDSGVVREREMAPALFGKKDK